MSACLFLTFRCPVLVAENELAKLDGVLRAVPRLSKALVHTSSSATDPYVKDDLPPPLVLQLYFRDVSDLEESLSRKGSLRVLGSHAEFPSLVAADVTHQAMLVRPFVVPAPAFQNSPHVSYCTYLVSYEGEAENINAWLDHYLDRHTRHMARFPGIRLLEVYTRLDWVSAMPWTRANFMQRNNVAFDSPDALTQALHSPVRHEMRADFKTFPPFTGPTNHHAMATRVAHRGSV
jgi:hypothetical protein